MSRSALATSRDHIIKNLTVVKLNTDSAGNQELKPSLAYLLLQRLDWELTDVGMAQERLCILLKATK